MASGSIKLGLKIINLYHVQFAQTEMLAVVVTNVQDVLSESIVYTSSRMNALGSNNNLRNHLPASLQKGGSRSRGNTLDANSVLLSAQDLSADAKRMEERLERRVQRTLQALGNALDPNFDVVASEMGVSGGSGSGSGTGEDINIVDSEPGVGSRSGSGSVGERNKADSELGGSSGSGSGSGRMECSNAAGIEVEVSSGSGSIKGSAAQGSSRWGGRDGDSSGLGEDFALQGTSAGASPGQNDGGGTIGSSLGTAVESGGCSHY
jgi:hypothetical protein